LRSLAVFLWRGPRCFRIPTSGVSVDFSDLFDGVVSVLVVLPLSVWGETLSVWGDSVVEMGGRRLER